MNTAESRIPIRRNAEWPVRIFTDDLASGEVAWTLKGAQPGTSARVTINGRDVTYNLSFDIQIDQNGQYSSTFGSTAPAGTYFVQVVAGDAEVSTTVRVKKA